MLNSNEHTLSNLRLVGGIKKHEYIQTDSEGNILSYLSHNFINCVSSAIYGENWSSTLRSLRKIYVDELPILLEKLIEDHSTKELTKIYKLLEDSLIGLENLKIVYQNSDELSHIDTIVDDFCKNQLDRVKDYIDSKKKESESIEITDTLPMPMLKRSITIIDTKKNTSDTSSDFSRN